MPNYQPGNERINFVDRSGQTFGRLTARRYVSVQSARRKKSAWVCVCECGTEKTVATDDLTSGKVVSCGCVKRDRLRTYRPQHGGTGTREHSIWCGMIDRCERATREGYRNYGGRGISVCERWRGSFQAFLDDMGPRPSADMTIERVDNDRGYEPGNCVWAPRRTQNRNKRNIVLTEDLVRDLHASRARGETIASWASRHGVSRTAANKAANGESWAELRP